MSGTKKRLKIKFLALFIALMLFFLINPFLVDSQIDMIFFGALFTLVFIFSVYVIEKRKELLILTISIAFVAILTHWGASLMKPDKSLYIIDAVSSIVFFALMTVVVLSYVIHDRVVTLSTLLGAICGYLLLGLTWSFLYLLIYVVNPDAFKLSVHLVTNVDARLHTFIYYSFVTMSTLGYGDIVPLSNPAKTLAWLEAVTGQVYLTIWIAQLVGLHVARVNQERKARH